MSLREIKIEKIEDLNNFTWNTEFGKQIIICYKGEAYISSLGKLNVISDTESELALVSDHTLINKFKGNYLIYPLRDDDADRWRFTLIEIEAHRELYGAKKIIEIY